MPLPTLLGLRGHCLPACPSLPAPVPMWGSSQTLPPGWDPAALGLWESAPRSVHTPSPRPQLGQAFKAQEAGRSVTCLFWDNRTSCCLHSSGQDSTDSEGSSPLHPVWALPPTFREVGPSCVLGAPGRQGGPRGSHGCGGQLASASGPRGDRPLQAVPSTCPLHHCGTDPGWGCSERSQSVHEDPPLARAPRLRAWGTRR